MPLTRIRQPFGWPEVLDVKRMVWMRCGSSFLAFSSRRSLSKG